MIFIENLVDKFCEACDRLSNLIETHQMNSNKCVKRALILKTVFRFLDTESENMKLKISKVILNVISMKEF